MKGVEWMLFFALVLIVITWFFTQAMFSSVHREQFRPVHSSSCQSPGIFPPDIEMAPVGQGLLLSDFLRLRTTKMSPHTDDSKQHLELGGCYVQKTNNYPHDFPDTISPWTHFVGSVYERS